MENDHWGCHGSGEEDKGDKEDKEAVPSILKIDALVIVAAHFRQFFDLNTQESSFR